ncbi:MAG: 16S rRNA (adenine(1518)-N(6)/adenine(1519)-N(6))-dimethyltransferase RsmA [Candidatus Bathyarchaeota archaeon]|nr:16S rRNA (adenine(1518)-N(6)/adenine(1519)-N(6))-dimethyltransferase RsmA [Candidatus Bathyarchaeota archaeon]
MSQEQIEQLLLTHHINPNRLLGQNFMIEPSLYPQLADYADLQPSDVVLDAGAGFGFLTRFLLERCRGVVAVEKDPQLAAFLREHLRGKANVSLVEGDVLKAPVPAFNKAVSIPPYYLSSHLVMWLLERHVDCAVMIVQREFAMRLVASVGSEEYGWLTVVAAQQAESEVLDLVPKTLFYPQPEVDSVILRLKPHSTPAFTVKNPAEFKQLVKWLFTQRNKKLAKALAPYLKSSRKISKADAESLAQRLPHHERRVRELSPKDFGAIADVLPT